MARIVSGVMYDFQMRKADETDHEQAKKGRHAERNDF